jgi:arylsulfatase
MAIHAAMIDRLDRELGKVLNQIKAMNAWDSTLILFLSDNGASAEIMVRSDGHDPQAPPGSAASYLCLGPGWSTTCNTPFRRHKTWVHEGGICTPLIAHWPDQVKTPGRIINQPGHVVDIVPTLFDILGVEGHGAGSDDYPPARPGQSLLRALTGSKVIQSREIWWSHEGNRALRQGDWKLVAAGEEGAWELYNLAKDRSEQHDLSNVETEQAKRLTKRWNELQEEFVELAGRDLKKNPQDLPKGEGKTSSQ